MNRAPEIDFRPYDPGFSADPYPVYARLRDESPVFNSKETGLVMFTRYDDVRALVLDARLGRSMDKLDAPGQTPAPGHRRASADAARCMRDARRVQMPAYSRYVRVNLLETEGAEHARLRRLVASAFGPRRIRGLRERVRGHVERLIGARLPSGRMEFIADVAAPLPVQMIAELLGWPDEERHRLRPWSAQIVRLYEKDYTADDEQRAERATGEFADRLAALAAERRAAPRDDLISALVAVRDEGERLSEDELIATCMLLLNAGHEATANAAGNGLWALLRHPEQLSRLRESPAMLPLAVDEMLRYDAPLQLFHRHVLEDLEWGGYELHRGETVGLLYGSANRDPRAFDRADEFDVGRAPNRHLAFGAGTHFCLGAQLARLELEVLFETLLERLPGLRLDGGPPCYRPGLVFRGLEHLPVRWQPARAGSSHLHKRR
jgi:cytochrome P450